MIAKSSRNLYIQGAFGKFKHGIITPQCVDKMLSNNTFLELRIQRLLDGLIFVEKRLGLHMQRMLKMSRVYTLAVILLPAHPASFAHILSLGCKVLFQRVPGCSITADMSLKMVLWTHKLAVGLIDMGETYAT